MVKRASLKGKGRDLLFEKLSEPTLLEDELKEEPIKEKEKIKQEEKVKVKKEIKEEKKTGDREGDKITVKEAKIKTIEKKEISFEEEHPLLTKEPFIKTTVSLSIKESEFLQNLGIKAKLTGGNKIPKNMIIRGFVKAFMDVDLDTTGLKIKDDKILFERVRSFIKK